MKYIPADKLISEIERLLKCTEPHRGEAVADGSRQTLYWIKDFITSLQQEQPFPRWIHANYSSKPEIRHTPSGTLYLQNGPYMIWLSDLETLPKDGTDLTNPGTEQPEVDLEKEVHNYLKTYHLHIKDGGRVVFDNDDSPNLMCDIRDIARHFYELGLNARKEE